MIYLKSGRSKSVYYVGKLCLGSRFVAVDMTKAEFNASKVLSEGVKAGLLILKTSKPEDDKILTVSNEGKAEDKSEDDETEAKDVLPDDIDQLKEIADSYDIQYGPTIQAESLKNRIQEFLEDEDED